MVAGGGAVSVQPKLARETATVDSASVAVASSPTEWTMLACKASTAEAGSWGKAKAGEAEEEEKADTVGGREAALFKLG